MSDPGEDLPPTHERYGGFTPPSGPTYEQPAQPPSPSSGPSYQQPYPQPYQQPYQQQPFPPSPYATSQPMPYVGAYQQKHPSATTALVLGIVAVVFTFVCGFGVFLGPFAWAIGAKTRREVRAEPQRYGGGAEATAGMILGIIATVLLVLGLAAIVLLVSLSGP